MEHIGDDGSESTAMNDLQGTVPTLETVRGGTAVFDIIGLCKHTLLGIPRAPGPPPFRWLGWVLGGKRSSTGAAWRGNAQQPGKLESVEIHHLKLSFYAPCQFLAQARSSSRQKGALAVAA